MSPGCFQLRQIADHNQVQFLVCPRSIPIALRDLGPQRSEEEGEQWASFISEQTAVWNQAAHGAISTAAAIGLAVGSAVATTATAVIAFVQRTIQGARITDATMPTLPPTVRRSLSDPQLSIRQIVGNGHVTDHWTGPLQLGDPD